jgi:hypothetical protein
MALIGRIISGGQTGADRAALDFAIASGLGYGGWCPRGGWAEDMPEPPGLLARYPLLRETEQADPSERTRRNVHDSDGALILTDGSARSPGTELTAQTCLALERPFTMLDPRDPAHAAALLDRLLDALPARCDLLVAGPRESEAPGIYRRSVELLETIMRTD